jgi:TPR repeat protein
MSATLISGPTGLPRRLLGFALGALALLLLLTGCAQAPGGGAPSDYDTLVEDLRAGAPRWEELDPTFLASADRNERLSRRPALRGRVSRSGLGGERSRLTAALERLELYYGDMDAHAQAFRAALSLEEVEAATHHRGALQALEKRIAASGEGTPDAPFAVLTAQDAFDWVRQRKIATVGALYQGDDEAGTLQLLIRVQEIQGEGLKNWIFDLTPTFTAGAQWAQTMGADSKPSAYIATRAQQGDPAAQTAYALRLWREGSGLGPETVSWLQSASEAGNLVARELLGTVYLALAARREGEEQSRFLDAAVDQLLLAVAQGSPEAMVNLAKLYLSGHFGEENRSAGVALLRQAIARDNLEAEVLLARLEYNGQLVAKAEVRALERLHRAADAGHPEAQLFSVREKLSTEQPLDDQSRSWLTSAAESGLADAMLLLGSLYADGMHFPQDDDLAKRWLSAAGLSSGEAETINTAAWILAVAERPTLRAPALALRLMDALMTRNEAAAANPAYLDTWAAAAAATGDFERAVNLQRRAVTAAEALENPPYLPVLRQHLEQFEAGEPVFEAVP